MDDDIKLFLESLSSKTRNWARISRLFPGRTEHHIKNRFICVIGRELRLTRKIIRDMIKKNEIDEPTQKTLQNLEQKKGEISLKIEIKEEEKKDSEENKESRKNNRNETEKENNFIYDDHLKYMKENYNRIMMIMLQNNITAHQRFLYASLSLSDKFILK